MFKHNLLLIYRNFKHHKSTFFINLVGLSTGLACALLIYLWVTDELNFDKFHENDARLYQVMEVSTEDGNVTVHESTQGPLAEAMAKDLPEIEAAIPISFSIDLQFKANNKVIKSGGLFAGKDLFKAFSFELIQGKAEDALSNKSGIVISENLAKSLFGSAKNALGKTLDWEFIVHNQTIVTGVFKSPPHNSSMVFDFALSYDLLLKLLPHFKEWQNEPFSTYLLLKEGTDVAKFNAKIAGFVKKYYPSTIFTLQVRPYSSAYLYGKYENGIQVGTRITYVKMFSVIAILILLIACINFMNLATARASRRLKEVGIKKTVGASRRILIAQFLGEGVFIAFLSLLVALFMIVALLPLFNAIVDKQLALNFSPQLIALIVATTLFTGLLAGSYPAFYLSGFNPVAVLKGKLKKSLGEIFARKALVIFQFTISLVLIVSVLVVYRQMEYIQSKNLGYDKANIIHFDKGGRIKENTPSFIAELKKIPGIENAAAIQSNVVQKNMNSTTYGITWPGKTAENLNFNTLTVDANAFSTLGIQMKEGRAFSEKFGADESTLMFNESAIKAMAIEKPVGSTVRMWGENMRIIGVIKDFHISSLHEAIAPMVIRYRPDETHMIMAKISAGHAKETIRRIEALYKKYNPGNIFDYKFLDDEYQALYVSEKRISTLSTYFAALAILISCLGLFGLATFNAEVRTKEIGIRKVLGASAATVMLMLSKDFVKLVLLAIILAFPLAAWSMNNWLQSFAYRIELHWWMFALAGILALLIALATVSFQAVKAAVANPIKSLRSE